MTKDKISVIMPVFNEGELLQKAVNCVLNQTHKNIELVIVSDGADKKTLNVLAGFYNNPKIRVVYSTHGGATSARMAGVKKALGEWIAFVDADDMLESNMYQVLLKNAIDYQADISHCGYKLIFPDGRINYFNNTHKLLCFDNKQGLKELVNSKVFEMALWNKLYKKSLFSNVYNQSLLDKSVEINEDLLMNYFLFKNATKSVFVDDCLYNHIVRYDSISRQKDYKIYSHPIKVREIILKDCDEDIKPTVIHSYFRTCKYAYNALLKKNNTWEELRQKQELVNKMKEYKQYKDCLSKKLNFHLFLITKISWAYTVLYYFRKKMHKNRYE